jgi:hypothetical protein
VARTTADISERGTGSGVYGAPVSVDLGWTGEIRWDTGGGSPVYAYDEISATSALQSTVSGLSSQIGSPLQLGTTPTVTLTGSDKALFLTASGVWNFLLGGTAGHTAGDILSSVGTRTASLNPTQINLQTVAIGEAPHVDLVQYQHATIGPVTLTAGADQTGASLVLQTYKPGPPPTQIFKLTSSAGQLFVSGSNITITGSSSYTDKSGVYGYVLRNLTSGSVIAAGAFTIIPAPAVQ